MTNNDFISIKDASDFLGVSIRTVQRYIKSDRITSKHINGKTVIFRSSLGTLKDDVDILKSTHERKESPARSSEPQEKNEFGFSLVKDSLDILRDQLRAKDDQIKELSLSVRELQTTQKLLIEKGLNLTTGQMTHELPYPTTNVPGKNDQHPDNKIINIEVKRDENSVQPIGITKNNSLDEKTNRNFILAIFFGTIIILFMGLAFFLIR